MMQTQTDQTDADMAYAVADRAIHELIHALQVVASDLSLDPATDTREQRVNHVASAFPVQVGPLVEKMTEVATLCEVARVVKHFQVGG